MLKVDDVRSSYGDMEVLHGVSIQVKEGTAVVLMGANGAGKSTLLNCIVGGHTIGGGLVEVAGMDVTNVKMEQRMNLGISYVPEGRIGLLGSLTVEESLRVASVGGRRNSVEDLWSVVRELFPRLEERRRQRVDTLSGGEQQMLSLCCALLRKPRMLILDEPSLGLAPIIGREVYLALQKLKEQGMTMLIVEERAEEALKIADYLYVMQVGRILHEGNAHDVQDVSELSQLIFGSRGS